MKKLAKSKTRVEWPYAIAGGKAAYAATIRRWSLRG
jgi:hypothetical protein